MGRIPTTLLAVATVLLPALSVIGHADADLASAGHGLEVVVTGHETPEPAPHIEARTGTLELYCLGCLLDKREPAQAAELGSFSRPRTGGSAAPAVRIARRLPDLPPYRSPRAPPAG